MAKAKPKAALVTESVPLADLHMDPGNLRQHDARNVDAIKASLVEFGQVEPLVVQKKTGRIIGGNGRYEAMKWLGWEHAEVVRLDVSDAQARTLGIALNRTAELASWDEPALASVLRDLTDEGVDVDALLAFDENEVQKLMGKLDDATPPEEFTEVGDDVETDYCCPSCGYEWSGKPK